MIVDTHVHYVEADTPERPHDPTGHKAEVLPVEDLIREAKAAGIDRIVQVSPTAMGWDNRYGFEGFERNPNHVLGVFARFDPLQANLEAALRRFATQPGLLGIRIQPRAGTPAE